MLIIDVHNSLGSLRAYVSVLVFKKTRITSAPVNEERGRLRYAGGDLQWNVAVDSEPLFWAPSAKWYLRRTGQSETQLSNTTGQFEISNNGLSLKLVQPINVETIYGEYRVIVSNGRDSDQRSFTVESGVILHINKSYIRKYLFSEIFLNYGFNGGLKNGWES